MSVIAFCPSRQRPDKAAEVLKSYRDTVRLPQTRLRFIVDKDDPTATQYPVENTILIDPQGKGMGPALNYGARVYLTNTGETYDYYGFIGDDHRFRAPAWDKAISEVEAPAIIYAFDGVRADLPTNWFISHDIYRTLGWLALPVAKHFYLDDAWRYLGKETGTLRYLFDITIEHLHFTYGKSQLDDTYERSQEIWKDKSDERAYAQWRKEAAHADIQRIKRLVYGA